MVFKMETAGTVKNGLHCAYYNSALNSGEIFQPNQKVNKTE